MAASCHRALLRGIVLVAVLAVSASPPALARAADDRAALATERYYSSYGTAGDRNARAAERYYSSYGAPEPRIAPAAVVPEAHGGGPSWTAAIVGGVLVAITAAGAGMVAGRVRGLPRHAGV